MQGHRISAGLDIAAGGAGQAADDRPLLSPHLLGDALNGSEISRAGKRKARLDHVDAKARQLLGNGQLFFKIEAGARRLLTIPEGGVEDQNAAWIMGHGNSLDAI